MRFSSKHFSTYPWHSINVIPHAALVMTYNDDEVPVRHGTLLEVCLFGQVFHIDLPIKLQRGWSTSALGPLYSRRKRVWYRAPK
jgi:hypothetical protein